MRRLLVLVATVWTSNAHADAPGAEALLRDADRARGGLEGGITWNVTLESIDDGTPSTRSFIVKARGTDSLAEVTAPPRNKGEVMLFNDRTLWFIKPGLRKPVSISARQKLSGMAANGDIASTNYARDYTGTVVGDEAIDGKPAYKLELVAKGKNVTYDRIRYWIARDTHLGVKAEFLTVSGDVFKIATFEYAQRVKLGNEELALVSTMTIRDATNPANSSVLRFADARLEAHAPSLFNINNVVR